jgi:hypothetical protein
VILEKLPAEGQPLAAGDHDLCLRNLPFSLFLIPEIGHEKGLALRYQQEPGRAVKSAQISHILHCRDQEAINSLGSQHFLAGPDARRINGRHQRSTLWARIESKIAEATASLDREEDALPEPPTISLLKMVTTFVSVSNPEPS